VFAAKQDHPSVSLSDGELYNSRIFVEHRSNVSQNTLRTLLNSETSISPIKEASAMNGLSGFHPRPVHYRHYNQNECVRSSLLFKE